ncbi:MAG TPA: serine/threonine-protein kinase [Gemmataceae bacterium]|nr:serine/threonine-protein kinase [Gemmataceae bacterium]
MSEPPDTGAWPPPDEAAPTDWPAIPGFEILGEVGRGGMGVVYRARRLNSDGLFALKLIRDGALAGPQDRARFRVETEAAARVRHANVVPIYEFGEHQGRLYCVQEFVEGGSLAERLNGVPWDVAAAARLVETLALAVQAAHAQKIVHRDLKPGNVLLTTDGTPKVADFGLAKRLDAESTALTLEGVVLGTPAYMAPEQAAGKTKEVSPAADVYSLGAILYELLTGRPPFQGDSWNQLIQQVLHEEPASPAQRRADVPRDLETICVKCLEKEASRRYSCAGELADDLNRFLAGRPVAAVPPTPIERLARLAAGDGCKVLDEIGRGPQAVVYRALYGPLEQPTALKVFAAGTCRQEAWEDRLRRDAVLWSALTHPQIVPMQRAGWWDGSPYLASEYFPNGSLAGRLAGRPLPVGEALRLVEQLAAVVSYLHRQGVVHGNLKPTNVMLAADGIPRLTDLRLLGGLFPIMRPAAGREPADAAYRAPEAARDPLAEPRPYTDIYALGAILYELLTGRPPLLGAGGQDGEETPLQDPLPPSRLNSHVAPEVEACCLRCLHTNPWRRYSRAYDLSMRLRRLREEAESQPGFGGRPAGPRLPGPENLPGRRV